MFDVNKTRIYGVLTLISLVLTVFISIFTVKGLIEPDPQQAENQLRASILYASEILPVCSIPEDRRLSIERQLNKARSLLELQHDVYEADKIYSNIRDELLDCERTTEPSATTSPDDPGTPPSAVPPEEDQMPRGAASSPSTSTPPPRAELLFQVLILPLISFLGGSLTLVLGIAWNKSRKRHA